MRRIFTFREVPPSINAQKSVLTPFGKPGAKPRLAKSPAYRTWGEIAAIDLTNQPGFSGDFLWSSHILFPCNVSKMDIDNVPKAIHDALVLAEKVPDDRYLCDQRCTWSSGDKLVVIITAERLSKWTAIKHLSKSLTLKLGKFGP